MSDPQSVMDEEANIFAVYLLMPEGIFEKAIEGVDLFDDQELARVARKFRVPMGAVVYRATLI